MTCFSLNFEMAFIYSRHPQSPQFSQRTISSQIYLGMSAFNILESTSQMLVLTRGLFSIMPMGLTVVDSEKQYYKARVPPHDVPNKIKLLNLQNSTTRCSCYTKFYMVHSLVASMPASIFLDLPLPSWSQNIKGNYFARAFIPHFILLCYPPGPPCRNTIGTLFLLLSVNMIQEQTSPSLTLML